MDLPITAIATVQEILPSFTNIVILGLISSPFSWAQVRQSSQAEVAVLSYFLTLITVISDYWNFWKYVMLMNGCFHSFMTEFDSSLPMGGAQPAANTSNTPAPDFKVSFLSWRFSFEASSAQEITSRLVPLRSCTQQCFAYFLLTPHPKESPTSDFPL
jgi:hypothetical protein